MTINKNFCVVARFCAPVIMASLGLCQCAAPKNQGHVPSSAAAVLPTEGTTLGAAPTGSPSSPAPGPEPFEVVLLKSGGKQPVKSAPPVSKMPQVPAAGGRVVSETKYEMNGRKYLQQRIVIRENPLETEVRTIQVE